MQAEAATAGDAAGALAVLGVSGFGVGGRLDGHVACRCHVHVTGCADGRAGHVQVTASCHVDLVRAHAGAHLGASIHLQKLSKQGMKGTTT